MKSIKKLMETNPMVAKELSVIATNVVSESVKLAAKYKIKPSDVYKELSRVINLGAEDEFFMATIDFGAILYAINGEEAWDKGAKNATDIFLGESN
jgi:hypothetical protein